MIYKGRVFDGIEYHEMSELSFSPETGKIEYLEDLKKSSSKNEKKDSKFTDITFLPGLIDTHIHFCGTESSSLVDWILTPDVMLTIKSVNDAQKLLQSGFTTVRTLGDKVSLEMSKAEKSGILGGPRIISAGFSLAETGGNDDPKFLSVENSKVLSYSYYCDGPWECRKAARMNLRNGAEVIKVYSSRSFVGGGRIKDEFTVEELSAISDEAHRAFVKAASHAYGESAIKSSIDAGFDSIEHGLGLTEELAEIMKKKNIFYVPTLSAYKNFRENANSYKAQMIKNHIERDVKIAFNSKVKIASGSDYVGSSNEPHGENYHEIVYLSEIIGNKEALIAATSRAAECVGLNNVGQLKKDFLADIIAVKGNPLDNSSALKPENIILVIKRGKILKNLL
jgi:imidazolonepropionase-like amidohydrolase